MNESETAYTRIQTNWHTNSQKFVYKSKTIFSDGLIALNLPMFIGYYSLISQVKEV